MRVELTSDAQRQIESAAEWWTQNRSQAPALLEEELSEALLQLARRPLLAQVFEEIEGRIVRKVRLPRTRYALYYTVDGEIVTVHACWHGHRGTLPPWP